MKLRDLLGQLAAAVREHLAREMAPVRKRLEEIDAAVKAIPAGKDGAPGPKGDRGNPGEAGSAGARGERGEKGEAGLPGGRGLDGQAGPKGDRGEAGARGERGEKGEPGRDGRDGAAGRDSLDLPLVPGLDEAKSYPRGTWASHNGGLLKAERITDPLEGKTPPEAGWLVVVDGLAEVLITQSEDARRVVVVSVLSSGKHVAKAFDVPGMIYRDVWRSGGEYAPGDVVTFGGSAWHCNRKDAGKPGDPDGGWTLCVKKGRDAK